MGKAGPGFCLFGDAVSLPLQNMSHHLVLDALSAMLIVSTMLRVDALHTLSVSTTLAF
jgi:hypothetical protein